jgi:curli biogenesis system outer membrane secretion channel CsgG
MKTPVVVLLSCLCILQFGGCASSAGATRAEGAASSAGAAQAGPAGDFEFQVFRVKGPKKRIGVLDFEDASGQGGYRNQSAQMATVARDVITEGLVKSGAFIVVEREQIANLLKEQGLGMSGALNPQSVAKASKILGLQAVVTGKITDYADDVKKGGVGGYYASETRTAVARVSVRVVDTNNGEIWAAESGEGKAESTSTLVLGIGSVAEDNTLGKKAFYGAIKQLIAKIVAKADAKPWSGTVVKVSESNVYVGAGSDTNVPVGALLKVQRPGEEIKDPSTGQVIGREIGKSVGRLQLSQHLNEKLSLTIAASGSGFAAGDEVTIEPEPTGTP